MLMDIFNNNLTLVIAAYNAGESADIKYGYKIPPYDETIEYVNRVYAHYDYLKKSDQGEHRLHGGQGIG